MKRGVVWACVVLALAVGAGAALGGNKPGNSLNAKMCQKDGWQSLYTRTGEQFASEQACASYGAQGGQIINEDALACLADGWENLGTATAEFTSEQQCVDAAVAGTTIVGWADVNVTLENSDAIHCNGAGQPDTPFCFSRDIWVNNDGAVAVASISISVSDAFDESGGPDSVATYYFNSPFCTVTPGTDSVSEICTVTNVQPNGGGAYLGRIVGVLGASHTGTATITSTSSPDPDPSDNSIQWDITAEVP